MNKRSYSFTLLEMMIALVILGLVAGLSAVHINKLINNSHFESEISNLFIDLQEAQVLAATYQTDIALEICRKKGKLYYQFSTNEPFTSQQFDRKAKPLIYTHAIKFQGKKISSLHFDIFSGRVEPQGILTFIQTSKEDSKTLWFDLQYGQLLKFSYCKPAVVKQPTPIHTHSR
jgi:prepilin-type N-terminal cleavage/methylation domain-containing protein